MAWELEVANRSPLISRQQQCADLRWPGKLERQRIRTESRQRGAGTQSWGCCGAGSQGSSQAPQTTLLGSWANGSTSHCPFTANVHVRMQGDNKCENESLNMKMLRQRQQAAHCFLSSSFLLIQPLFCPNHNYHSLTTLHSTTTLCRQSCDTALANEMRKHYISCFALGSHVT